MAAFNHIVGAVVSPLPLALAALALAGVLAAAGRRRAAAAAAAFAALWLWFFSTPLATAVLARPLEREYPARAPEDFPQADAIVLLGGGMAFCREGSSGAEMFSNADRVWTAARLYRAGKAPRIICTSALTRLSTVPLLVDLGVPASAVVCIEEPRNTEEEGRAVAAALAADPADRAWRRVIVVTSAWHMRRSLLVFSKAAGDGVEIVPAPCDFESTTTLADGFSAGWLWPSADALCRSSAAFKERYAYWGYRIFRGY